MFGSEDSPYLRLPDSVDPSSITSAWVRGLDEDLRHIRAKSSAFLDELVQTRTQDTPDETQNRYQPGDFVLFQRDPTVPRPTKLASPYTGPFEVIQQTKKRCCIPCGTTTMSLSMVRSAPSLTHIPWSINNFVCSTLIFYPIATAIVYLPSLLHVFDYTSYRDGGRRGSCIMYYWLFCALTIYVCCMVRTTSTLSLHYSTAQ